MGSYLSNVTTGPRQPHRLATTAIGLVAVIGIVTACTASSVGGAKRSPDGDTGGATIQTRLPATIIADDSMETFHLQQQIRRTMNSTVGTREPNEYELLRSEHQPAR